nr:atrial natriuretic peptide receptor 1-like [Biomphalaria glabrata]
MESSGGQENNISYGVHFLKPLLELALEQAVWTFGDVVDVKYKHVETKPGPTQIGALAAREFYFNATHEPVNVFFGPESNEGVVPLAYMAKVWNLPVITPRGNDQSTRNNAVLSNMISLHPFDKLELVKCTIKICQNYNWTSVALFVDIDRKVMNSTSKIYISEMQVAKIECNVLNVPFSSVTDTKLKSELLSSKAKHRVNILLLDMNDVRRLLLLASQLDMTAKNKEFLYIVPHIYGGENLQVDLWKRNDSQDMIAKAAFRTTLIINVLNPTRLQFEQLLLELNHKMFGNATDLYVDSSYEDEPGEDNQNQAQQYLLTGYHNAFLVYLTAVNETLAEGGNISDGLSLVRKMCNRTYDGVSGSFRLNEVGNRVIDMSVADMRDDDQSDGTFMRVGNYSSLTHSLTMIDEYKIHWPGDDGFVSGRPVCGFNDEICKRIALEQDYRLAVGLSVSVGVILLFAAIGIFVAFRMRHAQNKQLMNWWKINQDELHPIKSFVTKSTFSTIFHHSATNTNDVATSNCSICVYKGNIVRQLFLNDASVQSVSSLMKEFHEIRDINHPNLLRVLGACLEGEKKMLITEHCPKGSLQAILMDSKFKLDTVFSLSILSDIVKALGYLHKHPLRVHGRLTSDVCMIDSRFSVKVGYYGLPTVYDEIKLQSQNQTLEKDLLWVAPELLRHGGKPTPQGDVYSLAIIMSEMLTREEPYSNDKEYLTIKEVLSKIIECQDPPFRPAVSAPPEMIPMETLMKQCWQESPEKRPSLSVITAVLHGLMQKVNKSGGLVDNLLQRLEKYSSNLEKIVDEKVDELRQEKQKSEELLKQMLPASVADRLKAGLTVEPEFYDCVSIYFSDIVGFTEICSILKPVQIVNLLNDVYTCFDAVIGNYDVYKVETIGDAYMVVSGLPSRNGSEHARQIARMSLALLSVVSGFTPLNTCEDQLKLRIGLHSGPVCAGVVGLKMPRYCLFGDAVNTASRMESNGVELKIHMSFNTADILKTFGKFIIQKRGALEIKGKGIMETYWLLGEED